MKMVKLQFNKDVQLEWDDPAIESNMTIEGGIYDIDKLKIKDDYFGTVEYLTAEYVGINPKNNYLIIIVEESYFVVDSKDFKIIIES